MKIGRKNTSEQMEAFGANSDDETVCEHEVVTRSWRLTVRDWRTALRGCERWIS